MHGLRRFARWAWIVLAVVALVVSLWLFDEAENRDVDVVLLWVMQVLSFPSGIVFSLLAGGVLALLYSLFSVELGAGRLAMTLTWCGLFAFGYMQWFRVVPWLWARVRPSRAHRTPEGSASSSSTA
jgi:hypothetical protein